MTTERETLRIIGTWMEEGRTRLPGHVLDAVLDQLPSTPQSRAVVGLPWRISPMPSLAKLALTAVAIAAVGLVGLTLVQGPSIGPAASPSPTATPSPVTAPPPPFTERFDSPVHGLSISYPAGWEVRPATEPKNDDPITFGAPYVDVIFEPTLQGDLYIAITSQPLRGLSADDWDLSVGADDFCGPRPEGVGVTGGTETVDGAHGLATSRIRQLCEFVPVATDTRGYIFGLRGADGAPAEGFGWDWFKSVLETVNLRPEDAVDAPSPASSP